MYICEEKFKEHSSRYVAATVILCEADWWAYVQWQASKTVLTALACSCLSSTNIIIIIMNKHSDNKYSPWEVIKNR